ncbi:tyrosine-type recombinase/integrase [Pontibacter pamirensis]|uniref:tyrosine-type recombinase/integrase n=1 Tax=Pontibacter pamirensis TaxID=2562824 RepID=UPI001389861A|nr:tyrosine-type recombinase/integrase [Pontibacter pamirensis]
MKIKSLIYRGFVHIYTSQDKNILRVSTGVKASNLTKHGLLSKTVDDYEEKNKQIIKVYKQVEKALEEHPKLTFKELAHFVKTGELPEDITQLSFLDAFDRFIKASENGERKTEKGTRLTKGTVKTYKTVYSNLKKFSSTYDLQWNNINDSFYNAFCEYLWTKLDNYDNSVGKNIRIVRSMVFWCYKIGIINTLIPAKNWKVWKEEIDIIVLYQDEIRMLNQMPLQRERLIRTRDVFMMGVFTCFRVNHLLNLTEEDLEIVNGEYYINTIVEKTQKPLRVRLNTIAVAIIEKYRQKGKTLLPYINPLRFNINLKLLAKELKAYLNKLKEVNGVQVDGNNWNSSFRRRRTKKGIHVYEYLKTEDFISSHVMRRSGITNLLMMGMNPYEVQMISGHSPKSDSFHKYIKFSSAITEKKHVDAWTSALSTMKVA